MLYAVRRHLHYGVAEWDALPWWQQRLYLEGLVMEFTPEDDDGSERMPPDNEDRVLSGVSPGEFAAVGLKETWL